MAKKTKDFLYFFNHLKNVSKYGIKIAPYVISIASVIAAMTPKPSEDDILIAIHKIVDILALNILHSSPIDYQIIKEEIDKSDR